MQFIYNKTMIQVIRFTALALMLFLLFTLSACINSGVGGDGQVCSTTGLCANSNSNLGDPAKHIICCPNTSTCISEVECYGVINPVQTGGEDEPCNEDASCDSDDLICCPTIKPNLCVKNENCPAAADGDDDVSDGDISDGDTDQIDNDVIDTVVDGDDDTVDAVDQEYEVSFPESYSGSVCTADGVCWNSPWPTGNDLNAIWESADETLWIAGSNGTVINFDKEVFAGANAPATGDINAIHGTADDDIWIAGDDATLYHFDGTDWKAENTDSVFNTAIANNYNFNSVFSDGIGNTYIVGDHGIIFKQISDTWTAPSSSTSVQLNDMWAKAGQLYVIAGNSGKTLFSTDQTSFSSDYRSAELTNENLNAVWGKDITNVLVVGDNGIILHYDGSDWRLFPLSSATVDGDDEGETSTKAEGDEENFNDINGYGNNIYIVGNRGTVYRLKAESNPSFEGSDAPDFLKNNVWEKLDTPSGTEDLESVIVTKFGEIFVTGKSGAIMATAKGIQWRVINQSPPSLTNDTTGEVTYLDVTALGGSTTTMYTGYGNGNVRYFSFADSTWQDLGHLGAEAKTDPVNAIMVGANGFPYFFNDAIWKWESNVIGQVLEPATVNTYLKSAWGFADGSLYTVGGRIWRYNAATLQWNEVDDELFKAEWGEVTAPVDGDVDIDLDTELELDSETTETTGSETEIELEAEAKSSFLVKADGDVDNDTSDTSDTSDIEQALYTSVYPWHSVFGSNSDDIWVVGDAGLVAHRVENHPDNILAGESDFIWQTKVLDENVDLTSIWGDDSHVWIVATNGLGWYYINDESNDTYSFAPISVPDAALDEDFVKVWGTDSNHLFIISNIGNLFFSEDGINFGKVDTGFKGMLNDIWGKDFNNVYLAGEDGTLLEAVDAFQREVGGIGSVCRSATEAIDCDSSFCLTTDNVGLFINDFSGKILNGYCSVASCQVDGSDSACDFEHPSMCFSLDPGGVLGESGLCMLNCSVNADCRVLDDNVCFDPQELVDASLLSSQDKTDYYGDNKVCMSADLVETLKANLAD